MTNKESICVVSGVHWKDVQQGVRPMGKTETIWKKIFGFKVGDPVECIGYQSKVRGYITLKSKRDPTHFLVHTTLAYLVDHPPYHRWCYSYSGILAFNLDQLLSWNPRPKEKIPNKVRSMIRYYKKYSTSW